MVIHINYSNILRKDPLSPRVATPFTLSGCILMAWPNYNLLDDQALAYPFFALEQQPSDIHSKRNTSEVTPRKSTFCFGAAFIGCPLVQKRVSLPWFGKTSEVHFLLWGSNHRMSISAKKGVASVVWKNLGCDTYVASGVFCSRPKWLFPHLFIYF